MTDTERKLAAKEFAEYWKDKGYEKGESQPFWLSLLRDVFGVEHPEQFIEFESQVMLDNTSYIDGKIAATHVLVEQKSKDKDLTKGIKQSDGSFLTPFQQAKRYAAELPYSQRPRWIVTCNFHEFFIYDMEKPTGDPEIILLKDLPKEYYRLQFLVDVGNDNIKREMEISFKAGALVGKIYDGLLKQYKNPESEETLKSLNMLCVRLVFCLYAEDCGLFGGHTKFHDYIKSFAVKDVRRALIELFKVLDMTMEERNEYDPYMDETLASFPYVNGGLFADENIEIPQFNEEIVEVLLSQASEGFDWSEISPTIFGAVFESTLNPETRRSGGMHYTSIENIHKVIDPLFYDGLKQELSQIAEIKVDKTRNARLEAFRTKLAGLTFLDPACGSGNFLTETYISLRKLENEALKLWLQGQIRWETGGIIKVSIGQFYGIEINDFAVTVAKTALWIAESQMMKATEEIVKQNLDFLPLKSYANIVEGNALTLNWENVAPKSKLNYIMGNPPFVGYKLQSEAQKQDLIKLFGNIRNIDYVAGWYYKAAEQMRGAEIRSAFVSTNSITQGEQVESIWKTLIECFSVHIDFAYQTFKWNSESKISAAVHVVIIGFSIAPYDKPKLIFGGNGTGLIVQNINPYLLNAPNIIVEKRSKPICKCEHMIYGSEPREGGFLLLSEQERDSYISCDSQMEPLIKRFVSSEDFINNKLRYCFWLKDSQPHELRKFPIIMERLKRCKEFRENSKQKQAHDSAATPWLFASERQPCTDYLLIPVVSSENRKYIPIGYMPKDVIVSNACFTISNASLLTFGVITSNVHMAWMRAVCGRLEMRYRYSNTLVYNTFPWCEPTDEQKNKIEQTAQAILDARAKYSDCSLADLYDPLTMPSELITAHQKNDRAVMEAYGFWGKVKTESECVAELMKMYQQLTDK